MSYRLTEYARSLAEFGSLFRLPHSQGHLLLREIPGTDLVDAVGCYPLFACRDAGGLRRDLGELEGTGAVSVTLVTDPLGDFDPEQLTTLFEAVARPYKDHYLVDLRGDLSALGTDHHRRNARRCSRHAEFQLCERPADHLGEWSHLYDHLVERHHITGMARFSPAAFAAQLALPGVLLVKAVGHDDEVLGMQLWFTDEQKAWHHLSGYSSAGYRHGGMSYGLMGFALAQLGARGITVADLGAGAGLNADAADGLSRFKHGWSTRTRPAWLCGAILDPVNYARLGSPRDGDFFPAYRNPALANGSATQEMPHAHAC